MLKWILLALALITSPAAAQNVTCATRPVGDDTNACASTAFVQNTFGGGGPGVAHVPTNAVLANTSPTAYSNGIWRDDYSTGLGASPLWFSPLTGTCAANSLTNDGGYCVNASDGNSWRAWHPPTGVSILQFGADPTGVADSGAVIQSAISGAVNGTTILIPNGTYHSSATRFEWTNKSVVLKGEGAGVSNIWFDSATANQAGIVVSQTQNENTSIYGISFHTSVDQVNGNECVKITYANQFQKNVEIDDVQCIGTSLGTRDHYWANGIHLNQVSQASLHHIHINGKSPCAATGCSGASNMSKGVWMENISTANRLDAVFVYFSEYANYVSGKSERNYWTGSDAVAVSHGWYIDDDSSGDPSGVGFEAGMSITGSHCSAYVSCVTTKGRVETQVIANDFYKRTDSTANFIAVNLANGTYDSVAWGSNKGTYVGNTMNLAGAGGTAIAFAFGTLAQQNKISDNVVTNLDTFLDAGSGTLYNSVTNNTWLGANGAGKEWVVNVNSANDVRGNVPPDLTARLLEANSATPTVGGKNSVNFLTQNTNPTTITSFVGGKGGDIIVVAVNDANTTFANSATLLLRDSANVTPSSGDIFTFVKSNNAEQWREVARSRLNNSFAGTTTIGRANITSRGICTMASGTCSAQSLGSTYATAPTCVATWTGTGTLNGAIKIASTTTNATPSSSDGADTAEVTWACFGG